MWMPTESSRSSMKQTFEFSSHPENLASVRAFVRRFLSCAALSEREAELLVLGVDEACSNIMRHAYKEACSEPIVLCCEQMRRSLRFKLRDFGCKANPAQFGVRPLDRVEPGGLGIHFIRHAFDQVDFNLKKLGTELVLVKYIPPSSKKARSS